MQLVKHVLEDLARFNPEARMEPEIEIGSISPVTECNVTLPTAESLEDRIRGLEGTIEDLENQVGGLEDDVKEHEELWGELEGLVTHGPEDAAELTARILAVVAKADDI